MTDQQHVPFSSVLASCVHDMKNSLGIVVQSVEELSQTLTANEHQQQQLVQLHYEAYRLNTNLIQLLALYRYEQESLPLNIEDHYIAELIEDVLAKNDIYIQAHHIEVEIDIDNDFNWYIDSNLISTLINNVLINMLRYTKDRIRFHAAQTETGMELSIEDNGTGYPPAMLQACASSADFDPQTGRTGLGLHFARLIARAHTHKEQQGDIFIDNKSTLGGGRFRLVLP